MTRLAIALFSLLMMFVMTGCVHVHTHDGTRSSRQAVHKESPKECKKRCKSKFHACKDGHSKAKKKGPGASGCAKEKNACYARCK